MTTGIVGLGLIGGSLAKTFQKNSDVLVLGADIDASVLEFARLCGAIDGTLTAESIGECDLLLIAIEPEAAAAWLKEHAPFINKNALVIDCCGTKRKICRVGFSLAEQYGFEYAGGHPMAGTHHRGFRHSTSGLFQGASMVIVPRTFEDIALLERIKTALLPLRFGSISVISAEKHDEIIAFTSQLAHVVSNAYVKSPTALKHKGFSAGSYKDLTRVAWLNPDMWAELFLENKDNLLYEIDTLLSSLSAYRSALEAEDKETLRALLEEGRLLKEEADGL